MGIFLTTLIDSIQYILPIIQNILNKVIGNLYKIQ